MHVPLLIWEPIWSQPQIGLFELVKVAVYLFLIANQITALLWSTRHAIKLHGWNSFVINEVDHVHLSGIYVDQCLTYVCTYIHNIMPYYYNSCLNIYILCALAVQVAGGVLLPKSYHSHFDNQIANQSGFLALLLPCWWYIFLAWHLASLISKSLQMSYLWCDLNSCFSYNVKEFLL